MSGLLHRLLHPTHCYALCAVARSGAHLLSAGLQASRLAGRPLQYFHEHLAAKYAARYGLLANADFVQYVRGIVPAAATSNRVFGFRWEAIDLPRVVGRLRESGAFGPPEAREIDLLRSAFPRLRCIQLTRQDKLRQAISKARAMQSGRWVVRETAGPAPEPVFDLPLIEHCLFSAKQSEKIWAEFFQRNEIQPLAITYEDLCANYEATVSRVFNFLHIRPPRHALGPPRTTRQADASTEEWVERFVRLKQSGATAP